MHEFKVFNADFWMDLVTKFRTKYDKHNTPTDPKDPETDPVYL